MAVASTYQVLIERIKRHMVDGFPNDSVTFSDNEVMLHIQAVLASTLVGQIYGAAKITGNIEVPEGYLTTYELPALAQNTVTKRWYTTLPQVPVSLPLGYSVDALYFGSDIMGMGKQVYLIPAKTFPIMDDLPVMFGVNGWVEKDMVTVFTSDGSSLLNKVLYCRMIATKVTDKNAVMSIPPDTEEAIFEKVVAILTQRVQQNKDIILDGLPAGNKAS